jgi:hypothetical protein
VKGNCVLAKGGGAIFRSAPYQADQWRRFSGVCDSFQANSGLFSLGRMITITDNASLQNPPFAGRIGRMTDRCAGNADIQGTAPDDDPV